MTCKIGTLNLCLGLKNKKDIIKRLLIDNKIDICCLHETEIKNNFPTDIQNFMGYTYKHEKNSNKSRCGVYI